MTLYRRQWSRPPPRKRNTCFNSILQNHPPLTLSHRVQKTVLYMSLFCSLAYRVIVTIFLNSLYICYYTVLVFFFLAYFTLYNRVQFHPRILSYVKRIASPGSMHGTGCSGLVHWDDPEGWDGDGGGRRGSGWGTHVHPWRIHVNVWQNHYNIVK